MIPREQLEQWRALANAATPEPWYAPDDDCYVVDGDGNRLMTDNNVLCPERPNFVFTAAAREAVPALIAEVDEQAKEIERLRAAKPADDINTLRQKIVVTAQQLGDLKTELARRQRERVDEERRLFDAQIKEAARARPEAKEEP